MIRFGRSMLSGLLVSFMSFAILCLMGGPAVQAQSQNNLATAASSGDIETVSGLSQGGTVIPQVTPDGLKILYYSDGGGDYNAFSLALASMGLLAGSTVVSVDADLQNYLATEAWHLVVTMIQLSSHPDAVFTPGLIDYVSKGGKAILADWRSKSADPGPVDATELATAFQGSYTGTTNFPSFSFAPGSMLWFGLTSPLVMGTGGFFNYAFGLTAAAGAIAAGAFSGTDAAIVIGNGGNTLLNGFLQSVFTNQAEGVYVATNEIRYLLKSLNVAKTGSGTGTVTAKKTPINCGTTCGADFPVGQLVKLSAKADKGSTFTGWSGACSGTQKTCTVEIGAAGTFKGVTATFGLK